MRGPIRGKEIAYQLEAKLGEVVPSHTFRIKRKGGDIDVEYITKRGHHQVHMFASEGVNGVMRVLRTIKQQYEADRGCNDHS
jgi:hypothetical protein